VPPASAASAARESFAGLLARHLANKRDIVRDAIHGAAGDATGRAGPAGT
jgi:hypothetical protein